MGGNDYTNAYPSPSSPYATMFDINRSGQPVVQDIAPMHYPRQWANSLVLPDAQVLVTGGSTFADNNGPRTRSMPPKSGTRRRDSGPWAPMPRTTAATTPQPLCCRTARCSRWAAVFPAPWIQMDTPGAIPEVSLIGLSTVTHSFNSSQRRLKLPVTQSGALLRVTMPGSRMWRLRDTTC
jgi:galactose oxidase